jgi:putative CocE/NonD family hydrolase
MRPARALLLVIAAAALAFSAEEPFHREIGYAPLKDGVKLAYIVYRPSKEGRYPAVLQYDAYDSGGMTAAGWVLDFVKRGYAVVGANVRGSGCSGGSLSILQPQEGRDGAELVDWIGSQPWCNGRVGMYGNSYRGHVQFMVAAERPRSLKALAAGGLTSDLYTEAFRPGGLFNVSFAAFWGLKAQPWAGRQGADARIKLGDAGCGATLSAQSPNRTYDEVRDHALYDEYWRERALRELVSRVTVPALIFQGWQDQQTAMGGTSLFAGLRGPKKMILSNGGHGAFGWPASRAESMRWIDRWLKDEPNGIDREPPVRVAFETRIVAGEAKPGWTATFADWPAPQAAWSTFHLTADGRLSRSPATKQESGIRTYVFPVGTELVGDNAVFANDPAPLGTLVYRTAVLQEDVALLGSAQLTLYASSERTDTDFMVVLHDVNVREETTYVQRAFLRASHRAVDAVRSSAHRVVHRHDRVDALERGVVYEIKLSMTDVGHVFRRGHRIELAIMSPSATPSPDWGPMPLDLAGVNTVYHSTQHPSQIRIPIVPGLKAQGPEPKCGDLAALFQPCRPPTTEANTAARMR